MKHGIYEGKVIDACVGRKQDGSMQVELLLGTESGESVSWFGSMKTDESMRITIETLKFIGLQDGQGPEVVIGKDVKFQVGERVYQGKTYEDVKIFAYTGLRTRKADRIVGKDAASILFPKPYQPRVNVERQPGEDFDDMPDWIK